MADLYIVDRRSPEPLGSIARMADVAIHKMLRAGGYPSDTDWWALPKGVRRRLEKETRHANAED